MSETISDTPNKQPKAILAEDDEMIRELVTLYLEKMGYETIAVENGRLALDLFESNDQDPIELLVSDIIMPHVTGVELVDNVLKNNHCEKVLIISGYSSETAFLERAIARGCQFLKKPFTLKEFESITKDLKTVQPN